MVAELKRLSHLRIENGNRFLLELTYHFQLILKLFPQQFSQDRHPFRLFPYIRNCLLSINVSKIK